MDGHAISRPHEDDATTEGAEVINRNVAWASDDPDLDLRYYQEITAPERDIAETQ